METKATIMIDDDRWAKRPYGIKFSNSDCEEKFGYNGFKTESECYQRIENAKAAGYIVTEIDRYFY